jgi:glucose/arabinose dehydrogenase
VAPNGDIYIADHNTQRLLKVSGGTLTVVYRGNFSVGENDVSGIAVGRDGSVYFTTGLGVRRAQADGSTSVFFSHGAESDQAGEPKLAVSPDGTLYYSTGRTNPQVFRVATNGQLTAFAGTGNAAAQTVIGDGGPALAAQFSRVSDLAFDSKGALYIADEGQGVVRKVDSSGVIRTVAGGGSADPRTLRDPAVRPKATEIKLANGELGIAFDSADRLYISSALNAVIMRVAADGTMSLVAGGGSNVGPGLPALETAIPMPARIAIEPSGDLLVLVDSGRFLWRIAGAAK